MSLQLLLEKTSAKEREENQTEPKKGDDGRGKRKAHEWNVLITQREGRLIGFTCFHKMLHQY